VQWELRCKDNRDRNGDKDNISPGSHVSPPFRLDVDGDKEALLTRH
jgi:hypothetical protein